MYQKYIFAGVFFIKTIYSVLICILCLIFNRDFPFIPIQITLIDAVIEAFPAFFMFFEKNDVKLQDSFLKSTICSELPNGIAIFICCVVLLSASQYIGIDTAQCSPLMYLTVGFASLSGVIKASLPLNKLRSFLSAESIIGFICAVILFSEFLQFPTLSFTGAIILPVILTLGIIITVSIKIPKLGNI